MAEPDIGTAPRTWVLLDDRPGNCTQSLGLAQTLGWPFETRELRFGAMAAIHNELLGASALGVDRGRSDSLEPPWPDLAIAAGGRTAPVLRWIRSRSGGRTRIVQLGRRGGGRANAFDLVVTPENARLWPHPHRVETILPLNRIDTDASDRAANRWRPTLEAHPQPRIAVLVGGATALFRFGAEEASRLGTQAAELAAGVGGSIFVTTSRRTGGPATLALRSALPDAALFHEWSAEGGDNPFSALLALSDGIIVTGDSESMIAEACSTSKPVWIYPLPPIGRNTSKRSLGQTLVKLAMRCRATGHGVESSLPWSISGLCARAIASGWILPPRDLDALRERLVSDGRAQELDATPRIDPVEPLRETEDVAARVRTLFGRS